MSLQVLRTIQEFRTWRRAWPHPTCVAFVPTMGALHEGHASLVRRARQLAGGVPGNPGGRPCGIGFPADQSSDPTVRCAPPGKTGSPLAGPAGRVAASIFVNPTQFGPHEDLAQYPRTLDADCALLEKAGADAVLVPTDIAMYPRGKDAVITVDPGPLANILEGAIRPGHFRGVCTVVAKLLHIVEPTHLLMGQKDYQQQAILSLMLRDLDMPVELVLCPTVREPDGLAMSSRNRYLNAAQRQQAVALWEALSWAQAEFARGHRDANTLRRGMTDRIAARGLTVDYVVACHARTLAEYQSEIDGPCALLVAARLGQTRLIDNVLIE